MQSTPCDISNCGETSCALGLYLLQSMVRPKSCMARKDNVTGQHAIIRHRHPVLVIADAYRPCTRLRLCIASAMQAIEEQHGS